MTSVINFIFPLILLMSRDTKRNFSYIMTVGTIVLIGHWFNVFLMIAPGTLFDHWSIGFYRDRNVLWIFRIIPFRCT